MTTFRVRIEDIRVLKPVPCGMDPYTLMSLVPLMRTTTEDHPPVLVRRDGDGWRLLGGRHRFVAALMAGRQDILAEEESVVEVAAIGERSAA